MAYRAFDVGPLGLETNMPAHAALSARFTPLEARVVALADTDRLESVRSRTRAGRLLDSLFGIKRSAPLADPRLETLRRFTILARLAEGRLPEHEIEIFVAAGFSTLQARALQARALQLRAAAARLFE